jgi:hypothetical protein
MVNISKEIMRTLILVHEKDFPFNRKSTKDMKIVERKPRKNTRRPQRKAEAPKAEAKPVENKSEDLSSKNLTELKAIAKDKGLKGYSTLKKQELIKLIEEA